MNKPGRKARVHPLRPGPERDWRKHAEALDMHLAGHSLTVIAARFGITRSRAGQMVQLAKRQLAYRVFRGVERPLPRWK